MRIARPTIRIHARNVKVDETVSRGRQMFQVDAEPELDVEFGEGGPEFAVGTPGGELGLGVGYEDADALLVEIAFVNRRIHMFSP